MKILAQSTDGVDVLVGAILGECPNAAARKLEELDDGRQRPRLRAERMGNPAQKCVWAFFSLLKPAASILRPTKEKPHVIENMGQS